MLAFSPGELIRNGSFHQLKNWVLNDKAAAIQAGRGYYAVSPESEPQTSATSCTISSSHPRSVTIFQFRPLLEAEYRRCGEGVSCGTNQRRFITFEKVADRSRDTVNVVVALFDSKGTYVTHTAETERLSLDDDDLRKRDPAVSLRWEFPDITPGDYVIRFLVREPKTGGTTIINRPLKVM